jgi:hypothetical protein
MYVTYVAFEVTDDRLFLVTKVMEKLWYIFYTDQKPLSLKIGDLLSPKRTETAILVTLTWENLFLVHFGLGPSVRRTPIFV